MRCVLLFFLIPLGLISGAEKSPPPVATFSIVAVDPETGEIGVAVQSKIVSVGSIVPYAKAGVGAVATQAWANPRFGPLGLLLMETGASPELCIEFFKKGDPRIEHRQVAVIAADGSVANFTGNQCSDWAGGKIGQNYAVQGNILTGKEVTDAMAKAFEDSAGNLLAERLLKALEAGQTAGGDKRGRQSAGLLIVKEGWGYGGGNDRFRDLRVEEHANPITELKRVYEAHRKLFPRPDGRIPAKESPKPTKDETKEKE